MLGLTIHNSLTLVVGLRYEGLHFLIEGYIVIQWFWLDLGH
jgi:hypothetical protein